MAAVIGSKLFFFKKPDYNKHKIHNNCLFPARTGDKTVKDLCAWGADILVGGDILATRKQMKIVVRALKVIHGVGMGTNSWGCCLDGMLRWGLSQEDAPRLRGRDARWGSMLQVEEQTI